MRPEGTFSFNRDYKRRYAKNSPNTRNASMKHKRAVLQA